ncbi:ATP-binding protein [Kitasatospora sp. NBC_01539]
MRPGGVQQPPYPQPPSRQPHPQPAAPGPQPTMPGSPPTRPGPAGAPGGPGAPGVPGVPPRPGQPGQPGHPAGQGGQPGQHAMAVPPGATGHFVLPVGAPVQLPAHPPQQQVPSGPIAVLLIGPAGAGKTTVARHWAERQPMPTAHISLDDVREWVQSGFANPQSGWNNASEAQYRLARRTCGFACRNYLANGISCIIDDAVFPDRPAIGLGGWKRHIGPGMIPVVLLPGLDSVLARNARRNGNRRLSDEEVARIHGRMAGWRTSGLPIIDNSQLDVDATAAALDRAIMSRLAGRQ